MKKLKVGDRVKTLEYWDGEGQIVEIYKNNYGYAVKMDSGLHAGYRGGFELDEVELVSPLIKILKIKRSQQDTGLKVYGEVQGESGKLYKFAYFRRPTFRGWLCSCESFMLSKFAKHQNCKHLRFIRAQVGRYASKVE